MKYILIAVILVGITPVFASAHMGDMMSTGDVRFDTMRLVEDEFLESDELHEQMESLMERMMAGETLSDTEVTEMVSYMRQYPGVHSMMMGRYIGTGAWNHPLGMWSVGHPGGGWFGVTLSVIWLLVGVLALVWLARKVFST